MQIFSSRELFPQLGLSLTRPFVCSDKTPSNPVNPDQIPLESCQVLPQSYERGSEPPLLATQERFSGLSASCFFGIHTFFVRAEGRGSSAEAMAEAGPKARAGGRARKGRGRPAGSDFIRARAQPAEGGSRSNMRARMSATNEPAEGGGRLAEDQPEGPRGR